MSSKPDQSFPRRVRLSLGRDYIAVRRGGVRVTAGPLQVSGRVNDAGFTRLGLSISRFVGAAVARNTIKRRLREAFRLSRGELPGLDAEEKPGANPRVAKEHGSSGYDLLVGAKAHEPLTVGEYQRLLLTAAREIDRAWRKKQSKT